MSEPKTAPSTLFEKVWSEHIVREDAGAPAVLYVDLHLVHEVTSPQAFDGLRARGLRLRRTDRTVATMDHSTPTLPRKLAVVDPQAEAQLAKLKARFADLGDIPMPMTPAGSANSSPTKPRSWGRW